MPLPTVFLDDKNTDYFSLHSLSQYKRTNRAELERKKRLVLRVIDGELTPLQRICANAYWLDGMKQKDIAAQLGLSKTTVSRHISAAKRKVQAVAQYYQSSQY